MQGMTYDIMKISNTNERIKVKMRKYAFVLE